MSIYLDNAATTALDPKVLASMLPYLQQHYGNPSSAYSFGRTTRSAIETARRTVAEILGAKPTSIYFTSGGTESNNTAIAAAVNELGCEHIITSPLEHHAVLNTVKHYGKNIGYNYVALTGSGEIDYQDLEAQLREAGKKCLVTLMHANNETGSLLDLKRVGELCKKYNAIFHSDCVQTIGHYPINLTEHGVHFASASAHKFHGPKGCGLLYVNPEIKAYPLIFGGGQERQVRAGTENVYGIIGFAKALEMAAENQAADQRYITGLNALMRQHLLAAIPEVTFHNPDKSLYTVLSACFPGTVPIDLAVALFDQQDIYVSGGSACSSADSGSHVIKALNRSTCGTTLRFSFSKYNTREEIIAAANVAATIFAPC